MIDIVDIGTYKNSYSDHSNIQFEPLDFYLTLAKKNIAKFADKICSGSAKKMLQSEDAIANIANGIMMADWRWDRNRKGPSGLSKTQYSYRNQCAIWGIQSYITRMYGKKNQIINKNLSIDYQDENCLSLIDTISSDCDFNVLDKIIKQEESDNLRKDIQELLNSNILPPRQREYIKMYFFQDMTLEQIGKRFNITREAVRQGLCKAYEFIRKASNVQDCS
jgi:RNA polymerase sigma factor (sigma-70 family)